MTRPPGHAGYRGEPYQPERHPEENPDGYGQGDGYRHQDGGSGDTSRVEWGSDDAYRSGSGTPDRYAGPAWGHGQQPDPYRHDPAPSGFDREPWHSPDVGRDPGRPETPHRPESYHGGYAGGDHRYADRGIPSPRAPSSGQPAYGEPSSGAPAFGTPLDDQPTAYLSPVPAHDHPAHDHRYRDDPLPPARSTGWEGRTQDFDGLGAAREFGDPGTRTHDLGAPGAHSRELGDRRSGPALPAARKPAGRLVGVAAGVVTLLVAGVLLVYGSGVGGPEVSAHPDLVEPTRVVDKWLTAMFIRKDPQEMLRYTCEREADRAEVDKAIGSVRKAERDARAAKVTMKVIWSEPAEVSKDARQARVTSTLTVTIGRRVQKTPADFGLVFESGWRVCDADMP
jgi:hypothetical protein